MQSAVCAVRAELRYTCTRWPVIRDGVHRDSREHSLNGFHPKGTGTKWKMQNQEAPSLIAIVFPLLFSSLSLFSRGVFVELLSGTPLCIPRWIVSPLSFFRTTPPPPWFSPSSFHPAACILNYTAFAAQQPSLKNSCIRAKNIEPSWHGLKRRGIKIL